MAAPLNTVLPTLDMGATSWTGTVGSWDENGGGTVSYAWELRLVEDDSVVESGGGEFPQGTGTYDNANGYYLAVDATNTGGTTEARSKVGTLGIGLSGWYSASIADSPEDLSGSGNDGTYQGGMSTVADVDPVHGGTRAFSFDGTDDYIDCGEIGVSTGLSICAWIKRDEVANFVGVVTRFDEAASSTSCYYLMSAATGDGLRLFAAQGVASKKTEDYVGSVGDSTWSHVAMRVELGSTRGELFVDGIKVSSTQVDNDNISSILNTAGMNTLIGARENSTSSAKHFDGLMDDIRIYDKALSPAEINELYTQGRGYDHRPRGLGDEKAWYCPSIDDSPNDLSGNGNHATYEGGMGTVADTSEGGLRAYVLDGVDDAITAYETGVGGAGGWADFMSDGTFSASVWVKYDNINTGALWAPTWSTRNRLGYYGFSGGMRPLANNATWQYYYLLQDDGLSYEDLYDPSPAQDDQWHHVCWSSTAGVAKLYVDGVYLADLGAGDLPSSAIQTSLYFGKGRNFNYLNGRMDDIRIFDRALTAAEVAHLATGRGVTGSPVQGLGDEVAWCCPTLAGNAGDLSGNGNAGEMIGDITIIEDVGSGGKRAFETLTTSTDRVDLPAGILTNGNDVSLSYWVKNKQTTAGANTRYLARVTNDHLYTYANGTRYRAVCSDGTTTIIATDELGSLNTTEYYHYVAVYRQSTDTVDFYRNGVLEATDTNVALGALTLDGTMELLRSSFAYLDDFRAFNRALTQDEIAHLASDRGVQGTPIVGLGDEIAWYCPSIENSPRDLTNNGNDGTYNGSMGTIANTEEGGQRAYSFNGTNQDINLGNLGGFANWTCSAWVRPDVVNANQPVVSQWLSTTGNRSLIGPQLMSDGGIRAIISIDGDSNNVSTTSTGSLSASTWYHMAASHDGTTLRVYLDGVEIQTAAAGTARNAASAGNWRIGNLDGTTTQFYDGLIDDVRIYDRALTAAEINHLATGRGVLGSPPAGLGDEVAWYCPTLSGNASDLSGNGNTGEYNGGMGVTHDTDGTAAFDFDGTDDYINCGVIGWDATQPWTHSAWVQYDYSETTNGQMSKVVSNNGCSSEVYRQSSDAVDRIHVHNVAWVSSTQTFNDSIWRHHAWGYDGTDYFFALDGVRVTVSGSAPTTSGTANTTYIGAEGGSTRYMNGLMDDIRIYDRALSESEINHLAYERGIEDAPAVSRVQFASGTSSATMSVTAGNFLIVSFASKNTYTGTPTFTSDGGLTWTLVHLEQAPGGGVAAIWQATAATTGSITITLNAGGLEERTVLSEYAGNSLYVKSSGGASSNNAQSLTTSYFDITKDELVVGSAGWHFSGFIFEMQKELGGGYVGRRTSGNAGRTLMQNEFYSGGVRMLAEHSSYFARRYIAYAVIASETAPSQEVDSGFINLLLLGVGG
jgi:hypothetical protein